MTMPGTAINPQNRPERERIWLAMLNGSLSFEEGRQQLFELDGNAQIADSIVARAREERQAGLAAGASWTQLPRQTGPGGFRETKALGTDIQEAARRQQEEEDPLGVFRRYLQERPEYQGATGYVQRAMEEPYARLQSQYELKGSTTPAALQPTFEKFLGQGRYSVGQMRTQLGDLTRYLGMTPGTTGLPGQWRATPYTEAEIAAGAVPSTEMTMRSLYGSGTKEGRGRQFEASIQPLLEQMAPYFRQFFQAGALDAFRKYTAANPEKDWLPYAGEQRYF